MFRTMTERKPFDFDADGKPTGLSDEFAPHLGLLAPRPVAFLSFGDAASLGNRRSKLGGAAHLPSGHEAPVGDARPLGLFAQIDFAEMPALPDFPADGVLQVWVDPDDEMFGHDEDSAAEQKNFKVLYFSADQELAPSGDDVVPAGMPLSAVHSISFSAEQDLPGVAMIGELQPSGRWQRSFAAFDDGDLGCRLEDEVFALHDRTGNENAPKIGGYPCFFNGHPGERSSAAYAFDRLLLQLPSHHGSTVSIWGSGTANFMITRDDLLARDFSNVWYWLDH